jgi:hypothetical protein
VRPELSPERAPVTLHPSRKRTLGLGLVSLLFVAVGAAAAADGAAIGWASVVFFGSCLLVFATLLLPGAAYLRLDERGFTVCNLFRTARFDWRDVRDFRTYSTRGGTLVGFDFTQASGSLGRSTARRLACVEGGLPNTYGLKAEEVAELLTVWRERFAGRA